MTEPVLVETSALLPIQGLLGDRPWVKGEARTTAKLVDPPRPWARSDPGAFTLHKHAKFNVTRASVAAQGPASWSVAGGSALDP